MQKGDKLVDLVPHEGSDTGTLPEVAKSAEGIFRHFPNPDMIHAERFISSQPLPATLSAVLAEYLASVL